VDDRLADVPIPAVGAPVPVPLPESLPLPATSAQVAQFVAYRAAACVGADYANLALLDGARTSLRLFHDSFLDQDIADRYTDVAVDATYPIAAAVREQRVVLLSDIESYRLQFPSIVADTIAAGVRASASLPLYRSDGTVLGALAFAWTDPPCSIPNWRLRCEP
jgi:GAF domain-containing protein